MVHFELVFLFPSVKYSKVEFLDHTVVLFFISIMFSIVVAPVCIPINSANGFLFLHILASTSFFFFLTALISYLFDNNRSNRWYFTVVWLAFPWWLVMLSTVSCAFGHPYVFFWKMSIQTLCPFFFSWNAIVFFLLFLSGVSSLCILDINPLSDIWFANIFHIW